MSEDIITPIAKSIDDVNNALTTLRDVAFNLGSPPDTKGYNEFQEVVTRMWYLQNGIKRLVHCYKETEASLIAPYIEGEYIRAQISAIVVAALKSTNPGQRDWFNAVYELLDKHEIPKDATRSPFYQHAQ